MIMNRLTRKPSKKSSRKIKRSLLQLFSLGFAFMLWMYVLSSAVVKEENVVPVSVIMPSGFSIQSLSDKQVRYELKGPRFFVRSFMQRHNHLELDLEAVYEPGRKRYDFVTGELQLGIPFGVELSIIDPSRIVVQVDKTLEKEVPIIANTEGEVPSDHKLIDSHLEPSVIKLLDPASVVRSIKEVTTERIELNGLTGKDMIKVKVHSQDERVSLSSSHVEFSYNIRPTRANVILEAIPIRFYSSKLISSADRREVNLMILADSKEKLDEGMSQIEVTAKIDDNSSGKVEVELEASLPSGLHLLEIQPQKITVFVE